MYAIQLPRVIPRAGTEGGPPLEKQQREFMAMPGSEGQDVRLIMCDVQRHPETLPAMLVKFTEQARKAQEEARSKR